MNKYLDYTKIGGNCDIPAPKQPNKSKKQKRTRFRYEQAS